MGRDLSNEYFYELVREIDVDAENLSEWEVSFIGSLIDEDFIYFSEAQRAVFIRIEEKL